MKYWIITYGCQMNRSDSERIASTLERLGHKPAKNKELADLIVLNSCSVRQMAFDRVLGQIQNYQNKKVIIAGCVLPEDRERLKEAKIEFWHPDEYFTALPKREKITAFVPIMTGCNNFCAYCAVPYTRGREKSRASQEILAEIKTAAKQGYKEIVLLGQNVNSYRDQKIDFPELLRLIEKIKGDFWLSYITSHPKDMSDKLIKATAQSKRIIPYIHLPAQSGDNSVLKRMNRQYTAAHYMNLVKRLRSAFKKYRPSFPPLAITTDLIAGFPGETEKQFQNTVKLMKKVKFDMAYLAQYSPRPGTTAARLKDSVPQQEKKRRENVLDMTLAETALEKNKIYVNKKVEVLIREIKGQFAYGKTATGKTVRVPAKNKNIGDIISTKIVLAGAWGLEGN